MTEKEIIKRKIFLNRQLIEIKEKENKELEARLGEDEIKKAEDKK
jgi:hypothetical protein